MQISKMLITVVMRKKRKRKLLKVKIKEQDKAVIKKMRQFKLKMTIRKKSSLKCKVINQVLFTGQSLQNLGKLFKISTLIQIKH